MTASDPTLLAGGSCGTSIGQKVFGAFFGVLDEFNDHIVGGIVEVIRFDVVDGDLVESRFGF